LRDVLLLLLLLLVVVVYICTRIYGANLWTPPFLRRLILMRGFLLLVESRKVINELDPHFKNLILSQVIKRLKEQFSHFTSLLELILKG
jgi:hypothetical protein